MKPIITYSVVFLLLLPVSSLHAQDEKPSSNQQDTKYILNADINDSENKQRLIEKLDEVKAGLDEKYEELHRLEQGKQRLVRYANALEEISDKTLERSFTEIGEALQDKHADVQLLEESRLRGRLLNFFSQFENADSLSSDEYQQFFNALNNLKAEEGLSSFLGHEGGDGFFSDSLNLQALRTVLCGGLMNTVQLSLKAAMVKESVSIEDKGLDLKREINSLKNLKRKIQDKIEGEANIDLFSILMGLPLFCFTIVFLFIGPGWIQSKYGNGIPNPLLEKSQAILLDLSTVLLLTMSVLILGLSGNISSDVLGTLIGGISGYVLNKAKT